ncbi:MAG: sigma-70 family RNA polymerase sigma factor [Bacteroidales bacterium]|nr:sigma-70 family RNA polymerase sigma factor [Bacteroidales bacterium]
MDNINVYIHAPLIEECRKGNSKAQFRLYNQYSKAMYNLAYRILNNREDAEDILQEAFVECFKNLGSFRFESTFGAWLKKILVNKCINQLKKKKIDLTLCESLPTIENEEENKKEKTANRKMVFHCGDGHCYNKYCCIVLQTSFVEVRYHQ